MNNQTIQIKRKHYDKWERLREAERVLNKLNIHFESHNMHLQWIIETSTEDISISSNSIRKDVVTSTLFMIFPSFYNLIGFAFRTLHKCFTSFKSRGKQAI